MKKNKLIKELTKKAFYESIRGKILSVIEMMLVCGGITFLGCYLILIFYVDKPEEVPIIIIWIASGVGSIYGLIACMANPMSFFVHLIFPPSQQSVQDQKEKRIKKINDAIKNNRLSSKDLEEQLLILQSI